MHTLDFGENRDPCDCIVCIVCMLSESKSKNQIYVQSGKDKGYIDYFPLLAYKISFIKWRNNDAQCVITW